MAARVGHRARVAVATGILLAALAAVTVPVVDQQSRNADISSLHTDLAAAAALVIAAEYDGDQAIGTTLVADVPLSLPEYGDFTPRHTITIFGSARRDTLCLEGSITPDAPVWSYDVADGGIQEAPCETRKTRL